MASEKKDKRNSVLIKIYLFILFIIGIVLGFSYMQATKASLTAIDISLDNNLVTALTSNGIQQKDVIKQFVKEVKISGVTCNEYYKQIRVPKNKRIESFEPILKTLARNFKIDLSRTKHKSGSLEYVFHDKKRTYSTVVLNN